MVNKQSFSTTARANCNRKIPATIKNHLSPAETMCARRLTATKVADITPATPATTHLKISMGTIERHCNQNRVGMSASYYHLSQWVTFSCILTNRSLQQNLLMELILHLLKHCILIKQGEIDEDTITESTMIFGFKTIRIDTVQKASPGFLKKLFKDHFDKNIQYLDNFWQKFSSHPESTHTLLETMGISFWERGVNVALLHPNLSPFQKTSLW